MKGAPITAAQVTDLLRRAAHGEAPVTCRGARWSDVQCGNVAVLIDGWELWIFNDCDEADYVDRAISPTGDSADYEALCAGRGPLYLGPLEDLSEDDIAALERVLEAAPLEAP